MNRAAGTPPLHAMAKRELIPSKLVSSVRATLHHKTDPPEKEAWLDTGSSYLNSVLGVPGKGVPYGKLLELHGMESHGKTALGITLLALAQAEGALITYLDVEASYDAQWVSRRGLDPANVALLQPYVGRFGEKSKSHRLVTGEELCKEAEGIIETAYHAGVARQAILVDSLTALLAHKEADAGLDGRNMPVKMSSASLINALMRRWVSAAHAYNTLVIFTNQLRTNPATYFGDPSYTPGGWAPRFYCHVRARVLGIKCMRHEGKIIGVQGTLRNIKNKVGGIRDAECAYKIRFDTGHTAFAAVNKVRDAKG